MFMLFPFFMATMFVVFSGNTVRKHIFRKIIPKYTTDTYDFSLQELVNTVSSSEVSCGYQCSTVDWCFSFAYNDTMTTCSLYRDKIPVVTSTSSSIFSDRCPAFLGFQYEASLEFCYWMSTYVDTWQAANSTCHNKGATLAKTNTTIPLNFLFQFTRNTQVWVGGNDIAIEGTFVWSDGASLSRNDEIWDNYPLQPDSGKGQCEEDCCMIYDQKPMLHDEGCDKKHMFVCEYNL